MIDVKHNVEHLYKRRCRRRRRSMVQPENTNFFPSFKCFENTFMTSNRGTQKTQTNLLLLFLHEIY